MIGGSRHPGLDSWRFRGGGDRPKCFSPCQSRASAWSRCPERLRTPDAEQRRAGSSQQRCLARSSGSSVGDAIARLATASDGTVLWIPPAASRRSRRPALGAHSPHAGAFSRFHAGYGSRFSRGEGMSARALAAPRCLWREADASSGRRGSPGQGRTRGVAIAVWFPPATSNPSTATESPPSGRCRSARAMGSSAGEPLVSGSRALARAPPRRPPRRRRGRPGPGALRASRRSPPTRAAVAPPTRRRPPPRLRRRRGSARRG